MQAENNHSTKRNIATVSAWIKKWWAIVAEIGLLGGAVTITIMGFVGVSSTTLLTSLSVVLAVTISLQLKARLDVGSVSENAIKIVKAVNGNLDKLDSLAGTIEEVKRQIETPSLDKVFKSRSEQIEEKIITEAHSKLFLLQETGSQVITRNKDAIVDFIHKDGELRIVRCLKDEGTMRQLCLRNDTLHTTQEFKERFNQFATHMRYIGSQISQGKTSERVSIRYCPYPIAITAAMGNVSGRNQEPSQALIRLADFQVGFDNKIDFFIDDRKDKKAFSDYRKQFEKYSKMSYKKILISGEPHTGKTTMFKNIIRGLPYQNILRDLKVEDVTFYVLSVMFEEGGIRKYKVITSQDGTGRIFAEKQPDGEYKVDISVVDSVAEEIEKNRNKVLVVDEVGHLQLRSKKFLDVIEGIIKDEKTTLIGTITLADNPERTIGRIKKEFNVECMKFDDPSIDVVKTITDELASSVLLYHIMNEGN